MPDPLLKNGDRLNFLKIIEWLELDFLEQDISTDPVRQELCDLIFHMFRGRDGENIIKFFESPLFRFCVTNVTQSWYQMRSEVENTLPGMRRKIIMNATTFMPA